MKATEFEFRFQLWISFAIYVLGFWAPWLRYGRLAAPFSTTRLEIAGELSHWLSLQTASSAITIAAIVLAALGATFRVLGAAYIDGSRTPATGIVGAGPHRSLYLGSVLFALAVAIFMPPSGTALFLALTFVQIWRLILREEPLSQARRSQISAGMRWTQAIAAEVFYVVMAVCFAVLAWHYDPTLLIQALLICFGFSLVTRAFVTQTA